jgi:cell division protein FtsB
MGIKVLWFVLLLIIFGLQYRLWVGEGSVAQVYAIKQEIIQQKAVNSRQQQRNDKLYAEVAELKKAQGAIEESARNQLGMVYPEEQFFWLVESGK